MPADLYLHIPFCRSRCAYCALHSNIGKDRAFRDRYVRLLAEEISRLEVRDLRSVYIGGGTPSQCDLGPIFAALKEKLARDCEFTVEMNPADAVEDTLKSWLDGGANRISLGFQSLDDAILRKMGRPHDAQCAIRAFDLARNVGFGNVGLDLIAGYPGVGDEIWRKTIADVVALRPVHVSVYMLIREEGTALDRLANLERLQLPGDDVALVQWDYAAEEFRKIGICRYEVSNFSIPGFECRHNCNTWFGGDYIGLGEGAAGRIGLARTMNGRTVETVDERCDAVERAIFSLRTKWGLNLDDAIARFPVLVSEMESWRSVLDDVVRGGKGRCVKGSYVLNDAGLAVCDSILAELV